MKGIISVDGGGTKTEVLLVDTLGNIDYREITKSSNPNDIGMEIAFNNLNSSLSNALKVAKDKDIEVCYIFLGIAGIEFGNSIQILTNKLKESLKFTNLYVHGDLRSVVELGLSDLTNGMVIIAGTGFNMAYKENDSISQLAGWGYLADDYISGFDLGKEALVRASRSINGIEKKTILVDLLEQELGHSLWYSMADIYNGGVNKIASFSKLVMQGYRENDAVCLDIVNSRVDKLTNIIKYKTREIAKPFKIILYGGIFEYNKEIVDRITNNLGKDYLISVSKEKTVFGATKLAFKLANLKLTNRAISNFKKNYLEVSK